MGGGDGDDGDGDGGEGEDEDGGNGGGGESGVGEGVGDTVEDKGDLGEDSVGTTELGLLGAGSWLGVGEVGNKDLRRVDKGTRFVTGMGGDLEVKATAAKLCELVA